MPEFTITQQIAAPVEAVWQVLDDFGEIQRWSPGVKASELTSSGPVGEGATRHCDFSSLGGVNERIKLYQPQTRMTVDLYETFKLPISDAVADFKLAPDGEGTMLIVEYSYTLNRLGSLAKGTTDKQMRKGLSGMAQGLAEESERFAADS
jgi:carbon monoxide dehydrogenase subunit G